MKLLLWNARGCGNQRFLDYLNKMICIQRLNMLVLLETKIATLMATEISVKIKFEKMHRIDGNGHKGGI